MQYKDPLEPPLVAPAEISRNWQKPAENGYVILPGPLLAEKNMSSNFTSKSIRGFSR